MIEMKLSRVKQLSQEHKWQEPGMKSDELMPQVYTVFFHYVVSLKGMLYIIPWWVKFWYALCLEDDNNTCPPKCLLVNKTTFLQRLVQICGDACSAVPWSMRKVTLAWEGLKTGISQTFASALKAPGNGPCRPPAFEHDHILIDLPEYISYKTLGRNWPTDLISGLAQYYPSGSWSVSAKHNGQNVGRAEIELFFLMVPC